MRTELLQSEKSVDKIDWDKPTIVRLTNREFYVLTDGESSSSGFSGTALNNSGALTVGYYSSSWSKELFEPVTEPIILE